MMDDFDARSNCNWRESFAAQVDVLVRQFGASVFRNKWLEFKTKHDIESKALQKWEKQRQRHLLKVLKNPAWQDANSSPPSPKWSWGADRVVLPNGHSQYIQCWMPPELIGTKRPKVPSLLPLTHKGEPDYQYMTLDTKYAVLVLIHDAFGSHMEQIITENELPIWIHPEDEEDVRRKLPDKDKEGLLRFLDEITIDLSEQAELAAGDGSKSRRHRRSRKKADYATVQREAKLATEWDSARQSGIYKPVFARDHNMSQKDFDKLLSRVRRRKSRANK